MSLSNIRDSLVKNNLVSDAHARITEGHRAHEAASAHLLRQQAREADEVVLQARQPSDGNPVREEKKGGRDDKERKERGKRGEPGDGPENDAGNGPASGARRLDVRA